eukprot:4567242-Prymnesium_polylepis.1
MCIRDSPVLAVGLSATAGDVLCSRCCRSAPPIRCCLAAATAAATSVVGGALIGSAIPRGVPLPAALSPLVGVLAK